MHALVRASPVVAVIALIGGLATRSPQRGTAIPSSLPTSDAPSPPLRERFPECPKGAVTLASSTPCVALPPAPEPARERLVGDEAPPANARGGTRSDLVPRLPDRPEPWERYQLPVDATAPPTVLESESSAARGTISVRLPTAAGSAVLLVELDGQRGECEVVAVGALKGITVITRHRVARDGGERDYLVFHGRLSRPGPSVRVGVKLGALAVVGFLGGDPAALELDVRELRAPLAKPPSHLSELESPLLGFAVDPRNLLPLRP